tara:strand:+ start:39681 stop:39962 length:282 start_codon:yes stop_codon:yes gene_type:complete
MPRFEPLEDLWSKALLETPMSEFYETWKAIAFKLSRSERWCRYMARCSEDPLPVFKVGGIVRLNDSDLCDWLSRQRRKSLQVHATPPNLQLIA